MHEDEQRRTPAGELLPGRAARMVRACAITTSSNAELRLITAIRRKAAEVGMPMPTKTLADELLDELARLPIVSPDRCRLVGVASGTPRGNPCWLVLEPPPSASLLISVATTVLGILVVAAAVYGLFHLGRRLWRERSDRVNELVRRRAEIAARAELQHRWHLAGDPRGTYSGIRRLLTFERPVL